MKERAGMLRSLEIIIVSFVVFGASDNKVSVSGYVAVAALFLSAAIYLLFTAGIAFRVDRKSVV